tara:strand:+ start:129 stop:311 length:183 start_codon:yes stop_codon:yes gene_type:complete
MIDDLIDEQEALLAKMQELLDTPIPPITVRPVSPGEALDPAEGDVDSPDEFNRSVEDENV